MLVTRTDRLTAVEVDAALAQRLARRYPGVVVERRSAEELPFADDSFGSAFSFTMLHHVHTAAAQDAIFAETRRVLRPGSVFAGSDSIASPGLRAFHHDDTYQPVDPETLPARLAAAGFDDRAGGAARRLVLLPGRSRRECAGHGDAAAVGRPADAAGHGAARASPSRRVAASPAVPSAACAPASRSGRSGPTSTGCCTTDCRRACRARSGSPPGSTSTPSATCRRNARDSSACWPGRIDAALLDLPDVARTHLYRWGDGGAHFHVWFMPRPLGMLQAQGMMLPLWEDVLPNVDDDAIRAAMDRIGSHHAVLRPAAGVSTASLARRLGPADAAVLGLGAMLGAGVFAAWAPAARAAGAGLLIGLAVAGVVAYCNAAASAQLAAVYPRSGGTYVYGRERLGPWWGFAAGWAFVIGKTASVAAMALTVGTYAAAR